MAFKSLLKFVGIRQNSKAELFVFKLDVSAQSNGTSDGLLEGSKHATVTKNATGQYTFTLNRTARRNICIVGGVTQNSAEAFVFEGAPATNSTFTVYLADDTGAALDRDFTITVVAFYDKYER